MANKKSKMMREIVLVLVFLISCLNLALGQIATNSTLKKMPPLSVETNKSSLFNLVVSEKNKNSKHSFTKSYYGLDDVHPESSFSGILRLSEGASPSAIDFLCTRISLISGNIYTFEAQLKNLEALGNRKEVDYITLDRKAEYQMQKSRKDASIDKVHTGFLLKSPFTGKGIITGLIDVGIEYTNPCFRTENGDSLRITKAWAQSRTLGTKPTDFPYGVEFSGVEEIEAAGHDSIFGTHGTAVMGVMAASGYGSSGKYRGAAPGAQIIAVSADRNQEGVLLDGIRYVSQEAKSQKRRAVFNLSWGSHLGPHDGTSLFDKAIDSLVGEGLIIVGAAGNWGDDSIHISQTSDANPMITSSIIKNFSTEDFSLVDVWADVNTSFSVQINAIDKATGAVTKSTNFYSTRTQGEFDLSFVFGLDTTNIYIFNTDKERLNGRPHSFIAFFHDHQKSGHYLSLSIRSTHNHVHGWAASNSWFSNRINGILPGYSAGNFQYSVAELGGTAKKILTSGSHMAQSSFRNILGNERRFSADSGQIGPYSGYGPTLDGRTRPDITSPGSNISPANGFEDNFTPNGEENYLVEEGSAFTQGPRTWYWIQEDATSFAAPMLTGAVALMLEANPALTFNQIRDILRTSATVDTFTGPIPVNGSNHWGWGKLNAYKAVSSAIGMVVTSNEETSMTKFWYNNPVQSELTVFFPDIVLDQETELSVSDLLGREVAKISPIARQDYFLGYDLSRLARGQYIASMQAAGKRKILKITKVD